MKNSIILLSQNNCVLGSQVGIMFMKIQEAKNLVIIAMSHCTRIRKFCLLQSSSLRKIFRNLKYILLENKAVELSVQVWRSEVHLNIS